MPRIPPSFRCVFVGLLLGAGCTGCTGSIGEPAGPGGSSFGPGGPGSGGSGANGSGANGANGNGNGSGEGTGNGSGSAQELPSPSTRVARLTHAQWVTSVDTLLGIDDAEQQAASFRSDPAQSGFLFDDNGATLEVDSALWSAYQRAATALAERVVSDSALFERLSPAGSDARTFVTETGLRFHRRPLTDAQIDEYLALYASGATLYTGLDAAHAGVRITLEAMLQSPYFLYRVEPSTVADGDLIPLDGYEVAQRLSYGLADAPPDDELYAAAKADQLRTPAQVLEHAMRMLGDGRAAKVSAHFHEQLMDVERYANISPAPAFFPDAPANLGTLAAEEQARFIDDVVFTRGGTLADLYTSNDTFVNDQLAKIYGLSGSFDASFTPAKLPDAQRRGVLTHIGFLAANATSSDPDPIHRGVFVSRRILCQKLSAPPANVPPLPPANGRTNRETVEAHTQQEGTVCVTCHKAIINPLGFPFEGYDAVGAFRTKDNGYPIDAATMPNIDGMAASVHDALELASTIAMSHEAHDCYTGHWLEMLLGRARTKDDEATIARLGEASRNGMPIKALIAELVQSRVFLNRSAKELP